MILNLDYNLESGLLRDNFFSNYPLYEEIGFIGWEKASPVTFQTLFLRFWTSLFVMRPGRLATVSGPASVPPSILWHHFA